jgi:hypothetical protein
MLKRLLLSVCCLLAFTTAGLARSKTLTRNTGSRTAPCSHGAIPDSQFAIGDFDGDRRPDLATVELARFNSLRSRYSVSFQLSNGTPQSIGITGPAGGLALVAQDVNGDRALDLVLVTAWRHEPVAILLNDGQGNFRAAAPGEFHFEGVLPGAQIGSERRLGEDRSALSIQYSLIADSGRKIFPTGQGRPRMSRTRLDVFTSFLSPVSGRAPPQTASFTRS